MANVAVAEVSMTQWDARRAFNLYRKHVNPQSSEEDKLLLESYRQLARGRRIIDIVETIVAGGYDLQGRTKLAICRADMNSVSFNWRWRGQVRFSWSKNYSRRPYEISIELPMVPGNYDLVSSVHATAKVPLIPIHLRPRRKLSQYFILWEADWRGQPPHDPFLLRPLGKNLYTVVAQWDLTPLERAVMNGRGS